MKKYTIKRDRKKELVEIIISFSRKIRYDYVSSFSAHATLFLLMSLFPMVMFFVSVFQYLPVNTDFVIQYFNSLIPDSLVPYLNELIHEAYQEGTLAIRSVTIVITLVCASKGVYAIVIGMNAVYGIRETRNFIILYFLAVIYVLAFFMTFGILMLFIVFGNQIYERLLEYIPGVIKYHFLFGAWKYLFIAIILFVFICIIYLRIPNRKSKIRYEIVGAAFSTIVSMLFSYVFSYYIDHYADYAKTYGSLATTVIFILWIYGTMYIVFIGAEVNVVLRKFAEYGYNYHRAYEYYNNEYEGDLFNEKEFQIKVRKLKKNTKGGK